MLSTQLTKREIKALAAADHDGVRKYDREVAAAFGVGRSAIAMRRRRARLKLEASPSPQAQRYARRLCRLGVRRVRLVALTLLPTDHV